MPNLKIRSARIEDAAILAAAERTIAETPGLLVSRPSELIPESFEEKIVELSKIGRYVVAQKDGKIVGHALLDPMPLAAISHVFRLTIVVHPGVSEPRNRRSADEKSNGLGDANTSGRKD